MRSAGLSKLDRPKGPDHLLLLFNMLILLRPATAVGAAALPFTLYKHTLLPLRGSLLLFNSICTQLINKTSTKSPFQSCVKVTNINNMKDKLSKIWPTFGYHPL